MALPSHRYTLPIVLQDLPPAEALLQAFDNLQSLNDAINDVFSRISSRISQERSKIQNVNSRVASAATKVERISQNQTKVTTIHSAAKFPSPKQLPDFQRVFDECEDHTLKKPKHSEYNLTTKQRTEPPHHSDTSEIFTTFSKARATRQDTDKQGSSAEGLGRLPSYLPSVSSILLFNSDENPYKKYVSFNNLEGTGGQDRVVQQTELHAAPKSLFEGTGLPTFAALAYEYKPDLGQVPQFQLPQNLPLGKLADLNFGVNDQVASIAPSLGLPALPTFDAFGSVKALPAPARQKSVAPAAAPAASPAAPAAPAAPGAPAAPAPPAPPPQSSTVLGSDGPPSAPPMAPPPLPPPGPPEMPSAASPSEPVSSPTDGGGGRNDLLAAIRNRGNMSKLRKVKRDEDGNPINDLADGGGGGGKSPAAAAAAAPKAKAKAPPPGDMMAALRERLARRHTVMSGKIDKEQKSDAPSASPDGPKPGSRLTLPRLGEAKRPGPGARKPLAAEGDEKDGGEDGEETGGAPPKANSKMSDVVIAAYVEAHKTKQAKQGAEGWDDD